MNLFVFVVSRVQSSLAQGRDVVNDYPVLTFKPLQICVLYTGSRLRCIQLNHNA